ncbi:nucleotide-diphospho-sugar transferase-domain-containing protein [Zychaea mexicana]|uniref:nucleotide-diphospho-sugar transferase-domain-containing protein n=1 Tax=Zychaea mexicana TaxID=64656 RepID=UPI0022FE2E5A|nr:nucleotide-diphospho-sugar transferase-domain-containing protein [Zychaea mexicana]KAI9498630.1 nucleotide-diphospho-sugar transferase-domain-containing protein [Zychaea mexicana]
MPVPERSTRRALIVVLAITIATTLIYISVLAASGPTWVPASSQTVPAGYLRDQQHAFNATHTNSTEPWHCTCYSYDSDQPLPEVPESGDQKKTGAKDPIIVPESFTDPPQELMDKINKNLVQGRVLLIATANYGMRDYMYNWIESLKLTGVDKFLVFCLDDKLYTHLVNAGYEENAATIPESWLHLDVATDFEDYFSPRYRIITHAKTLVVQRLLYLDVTVFFSDVDIVFLRPRMIEFVKTYMDMRQETHAIFQQEGLDTRQINSGFYLIKPEYDMKRMLAQTIYLQDSNEGLTQQGAMNRALDEMVKDIRSSSVVLLDVMFFPNGYAYFDKNLSKSRGVEPYILHANFRVAGDKKKELVTLGFWYLDEEWLKKVDAQFEQSWQEQMNAITPGNSS